MKIKTTKTMKIVQSENYNYTFRYKDGLFMRWGKEFEDDPSYSPFGPEILDMEVSTICHGVNGVPCPWCYKSNTSKGKNMTFKTFKTIFHKIPRNLTQIAFGIGDIDSNPDLFNMFRYCRENSYNKVIPNVTINGWNLTEKYADKLASLCGAVAVSNYDREICYNAVEILTDRIGVDGTFLKQVNIHQLTAEETYDQCKETLKDSFIDKRLRKLNAVLFLALKQKGTRNTFHSLPSLRFKELVNFALENGIPIGMDSCSAYKFLSSVKEHPQYKKIEMMVEPCESGLFSFYVNVEGISYFCSFLEGESEILGFDVVKTDDFLREIWEHPHMKNWRNKLLSTADGNELHCRKCPHFAI